MYAKAAALIGAAVWSSVWVQSGVAAHGAVERVRGARAAVVEHEEWGERVTACVVPRQGQSIIPENLSGFLKTRLSGFKVPKEYIIVEELPKSSAGKILKRELKKQFSSE